MPATVTTTAFKQVKEYVLTLKQRQGAAPILLAPAELRSDVSAAHAGSVFALEELLTAIRHLAKHGYVRVLRASSGEYSILLRPELVNNLAASFILEARRNPKGLGALTESGALTGAYLLPEITGLEAQEQRILIDATVVLFIEHHICFRETLGSTTFLVFPELINLKRPRRADSGIFEEGVSYRVVGAAENLFASLVVLLGYTNTFARAEHWASQAEYEMENGSVCGFRYASARQGECEFVLYYSSGTPPGDRSLFEALFERFLSRKEADTTRYAPLACPKCGYVQSRVELVRRTEAGKDFLRCSECGARVRLALPSGTRLSAARRRIVEQEQVTVQRRTEFEVALVRVKALVRDLRGSLEGPSCYVSYAWGVADEEKWVEFELATDLRNAGVEILLDRWQSGAIGSSVARFVSRIAECDMVIAVGTPAYRLKTENLADQTSGSIAAAEADVMQQRLLGTEEQKRTVLPVLLTGSEEESFPALMRGRVFADFRERKRYFERLLDLTLTLFGVPFDAPGVSELRRGLATLPSKSRQTLADSV